MPVAHMSVQAAYTSEQVAHMSVRLLLHWWHTLAQLSPQKMVTMLAAMIVHMLLHLWHTSVQVLPALMLSLQEGQSMSL
jgi:hypothetical protein